MSAPIIDPDRSTNGLLEELIVTIALLEANTHAAFLAPPFVDLYEKDWTKLALEEVGLLIAAHRADALVTAADDGLDDFVDDHDKLLLRKVKSNREDPLYAFYFGKKRPHELKRPVLVGQLDTMRAWVNPMKTSPDTELVAMGTRLEALVANADMALTKQSEASGALKTFRKLGAKKIFIDKLNALRKSTDGKLAELPHANPDARLPNDFASRFFKHGPRRGKTAAKEVTSAALKEQIADTRELLSALETQLVDVLAKEEAEALAAAHAEADKAALAAAEKEAAEAAAKVAALKAKLNAK